MSNIITITVPILIPFILVLGLAMMYCLYKIWECNERSKVIKTMIDRLEHPVCDVCGKHFDNYDNIDTLIRQTVEPYYRCMCNDCAKTHHFWVFDKAVDRIEYCVLKRGK